MPVVTTSAIVGGVIGGVLAGGIGGTAFTVGGIAVSWGMVAGAAVGIGAGVALGATVFKPMFETPGYDQGQMPDTPEYAQARASAKDEAKLRRRRLSSTILTGPQGALNTPSTGKVMLGS